MKTISLGDSGAQVSEFGMGTMMLGTLVDKATSFAILDAYVEAGGTYLDTANMYAHWGPGGKGGDSELLLGEWMRERGNRSRMCVATKGGVAYPGVQRGLKGSWLLEECDKSLKRLGVDVIDLYYAHADDRNTPMDEPLEALDKMVRAGKVRHVAASNFVPWRLAQARLLSEMHGWPKYCAIQQRHSYLRAKPGTDFGDQIATTVDLIDYCRSENVRMFCYSPLLGGVYNQDEPKLREQYAGADTDARLGALRAVATEVGATPIQVVLAWMRYSDPQVIPLVTAQTVEQMKENLGALMVDLNADQMSRLTHAHA